MGTMVPAMKAGGAGGVELSRLCWKDVEKKKKSASAFFFPNTKAENKDCIPLNRQRSSEPERGLANSDFTERRLRFSRMR